MPADLRTRAAEAKAVAVDDDGYLVPADAAQPPHEQDDPPPAIELPDVDPADDAQLVDVHIAWARVMADVQYIGKGDWQKQAEYHYRGVDRAMNTFGPVLRRHGVLVIPTGVEAAYRDTKTSTGKATRECTVTVQYRIYGPKGDHLDAASQGEALDTGDKGTAKAMSVALRVLLFAAGMVPTEESRSADRDHFDRGEQIRTAMSYRDEALDPNVSVSRLRQMHTELKGAGRLGELVPNEVGDDEGIGALVGRVGKERAGHNGGAA